MSNYYFHHLQIYRILPGKTNVQKQQVYQTESPGVLQTNPFFPLPKRSGRRPPIGHVLSASRPELSSRTPGRWVFGCCLIDGVRTKPGGARSPCNNSNNNANSQERERQRKSDLQKQEESRTWCQQVNCLSSVAPERNHELSVQMLFSLLYRVCSYGYRNGVVPNYYSSSREYIRIPCLFTQLKGPEDIWSPCRSGLAA